MDFWSAELGVGLCVELALILLLLKTRAFRTLPAFFVYICSGLLGDLGLWAARSFCSPEAYFHIFTAQIILDSALMFAVLVELACNLLAPIRTFLPRYTWLGIAAMIALCGLILWPVAGWTLPVKLSASGAFFYRLQQTVALLRVLIFLAIGGFSRMLNLGWRNREMQLATGLGAYSLIALVISVLHGHQKVGTQYHLLDLVNSVSYLIVLFYWVFCFVSKEAERQEFTAQMRGFLLAVAGTAHSNRVVLQQSLRPPLKDGEES